MPIRSGGPDWAPGADQGFERDQYQPEVLYGREVSPTARSLQRAKARRLLVNSSLEHSPRGHAKTTLFLHRAARRIGSKAGYWRLGILTAVDVDAEARSRATRTLVEHPRFAEVFPWAQDGVEGLRWRDGAWTIRGVDLGKDATCTAMSLGSVRAGSRLDELLADDPVGPQENATPAARAKALETLFGVVDPMVVNRPGSDGDRIDWISGGLGGRC